MNPLALMFCLGVFTLVAQMVVTREMMTLCLGNELTLSVVFTVWLLAIGAGAWLGRRWARGTAEPRLMRGVVAPMFWLAVVLPAAVVGLRMAGGLVRGGAGEYPSLTGVVTVAFLSLVPLCLPAGLVFPPACQVLLLRRKPGAVGVVYAVEAAGSFVGGAAVSFLLVERLGALQSAVLASAVALLGASLGARGRGVRRGTALAAGLLAVLALYPGGLDRAEFATAEARWRSLGVVRAAAAGQDSASLVASLDTRYQNLALVESAGHYTLYGDGRVLFAFPDKIGAENAIHFIMAQNPAARRILLVGGNPLDDLPELFRYPVDRVVYVELDPGIERLLRRTVPHLYAQATGDRRFVAVHDDAPRFARRCREQFDAILVRAPEPLTANLNRYYTREFYADLRRILAPAGFVYTAVEGSERLEEEAARTVASVFGALRSVFGNVRVTAGTPVQFFAGTAESPLTFDRQTLRERSRGVLRGESLPSYFRPEYFLDADEIAPDKVAARRARLEAARVPPNTMERPVSFYYNLVLWSRFSGSRIESLLRGAETLRPAVLCAVVMAFGLAGLGWGVVRKRHPRGGKVSDHSRPTECFETGPTVGREWLSRRNLPAASGRDENNDRRGDDPVGASGGLKAIAVSFVALAGFCGVAGEMLCLYVFQAVHGYVYSVMGFMVGLFMLGSVAGARVARRADQCAAAGVVQILVALQLGMAAVTLLLPWLGGLIPFGAGFGGRVEAPGLLYAVVAFFGVRLAQLAGAADGAAAGVIDAADYAGSAIGGILVGLLFVPVFGLRSACVVLASILFAGMLWGMGLLRRL